MVPLFLLTVPVMKRKTDDRDTPSERREPDGTMYRTVSCICQT